MSKKKMLLSIVTSLVLAMSLMLVGCGGSGDSSGSGSTGSDESASPTSLEAKTVTEGVLTVGSDCDYPPFIEMDGEQVLGYEYDLLEAIAHEMGYELEYLAPQNFDGLLAALASNTKMDVAVSSFTINDERKELVDFTTPYFDSNQAVVTMATADYAQATDLDGKVVGAQSGTTGADWVKENLSSDTTLKEFNQVSEVMAALVAGDIEAAFYDEPAAANLTSTLYTETHIIESIPTGEQYGIAVSKDNPGLTADINEAMKKIKENGTFDKIFEKYFPGLTPPSLGTNN